MTTHEALVAARKLIEDESKWTRGYYARDEQGRPIRASDPDAVCWCSIGALMRVSPGRFRRAAGALRDQTAGEVSDLNDGPNRLPRREHPRRAPARHKMVLAAFDRAIEATK